MSLYRQGYCPYCGRMRLSIFKASPWLTIHSLLMFFSCGLWLPVWIYAMFFSHGHVCTKCGTWVK